MNSYTKKVSKQLNELLEKNYDAEKGYLTASEHADSILLTGFFKKKSNERKEFSEELKKEITLFNEAPNESGSIKGTAHRAWMDTKAFFTPDNDEAMLQETIRGEKAAIAEYNDVINAEEYLPKSTFNLLESQRNTIISDALLIKTIEDIK